MSGSGPYRELTRNAKVDATIHNEYLTRSRVDELEAQLRFVIGRLSVHEQLNFNGRLRWLLFGGK